MGPFRAGIFYGIVAVVVALATNLHFLLIDASGPPDWVVGVWESYRTHLALAAFLLCAIVAAIRTVPQRLDEGVPYRSLLLRDCTLAATIVAVMAGFALIVIVFLQATVFYNAMQGYAETAAPRIVGYIQELGERFSSPPDPVTAGQIEQDLAPPTLGDLGQSISNFVLRALLLGGVGAIVGLMRGRSANRQNAESEKPREPEPQSYPYEEGDADVSRNGADYRDS